MKNISISTNKRMLFTLTTLLIVVILFMFLSSATSYAEEVSTPIFEDPVDEDWVEYDSIPVYEYINNSQHMVSWYQRFYNPSTGGFMVNGVPHRTYPESHTVPAYSYSGSNYHSGTMHYFQYAGNCSFCGGTVTNWVSGLCPGNGHCISPFEIPELSE